MALGDVLIELQVPPLPGSAQESYSEYFSKVKKAASLHFQSNGLEPARYCWIQRYDVPEAPPETPAYLRELLEETSIPLDDYSFTVAPSPGTTNYCISNGHVDCYTVIVPTPNSQSNENAFAFTVHLSGGEVVTVPFVFMARWWQEFPSQAAG